MLTRTDSFGYWLRRRRKALDLTQVALARLVFCSGFTIRKIEADERRPSRPLAERLAVALAIPEEERRDFLAAARALQPTSRLPISPTPVGSEMRAVTPAAAIHFPHNSPPVCISDAAPFVGRDIEYGLLTGLIVRLTSGAGDTVLIEGEAGIGKSRLLREVTRYAHAHDFVTLATNCYEIESAMPYQPVIDLVTRVLERAGDAALATLAPVSLAELAAMVPGVGERFAHLPPLSNAFPEARQARLCRAVDQLIEAARAGRPMIIMVDDIQWADAASTQVLHYLARQAAQRALLLIYAYSEEAVDSDERFAQLLDSLRHDSGARHLPLARLAYADTETLVAALAAATPDVASLAGRLQRETEGNPFFLMAILQGLSEGETQLDQHTSGALLPEALRAAVRGRLAHVPKALRPLLEIAAVLGRRFDFDTLLEVSHEPEPQLLDAVETLVKCRLLREQAEGGVYDFSHDKVREVVYRDIGGVRRRLLHQSVAEALERRAENTAHERAAQLAEHYERAHAWAKALHCLVLAAQHSQALLAMRDALYWLDRAVALAAAHPEALDAEQHFAIYEQRSALRAQAGQAQGCRRHTPRH